MHKQEIALERNALDEKAETEETGPNRAQQGSGGRPSTNPHAFFVSPEPENPRWRCKYANLANLRKDANANRNGVETCELTGLRKNTYTYSVEEKRVE